MIQNPIRLVLQDELLRGCALDTIPDGAIRFSTDKNWKAALAQAEADLEAVNERPLVIASIQVCDHIQRFFPRLSRGVIVNYDKTSFAGGMSAIPAKHRLNKEFFLLPFGEVLARKDQLQMLFGGHIFLRPNTSRKIFTGVSIQIDKLSEEINALRQTSTVFPDDLCVVDRHRPVKRTEYRTHLIEGQVVSVSRYSHFGAPRPDVPDEILAAAQEIARVIEMHDDAIVADFAICPETDSVCVVELNGLSTSGLYAGVDLNAIIQAMDNLLL